MQEFLEGKHDYLRRVVWMRGFRAVQTKRQALEGLNIGLYFLLFFNFSIAIARAS